MSLTPASVRKRLPAALAATAVSLTLGTALAAPAKAQSGCPDVEVVFARGTLDPGIVGGPFAGAVKQRLVGKNVTNYDVDYAADVLQTSAGAGATDMTRHVKATAAKCSKTKFVLGGYSQGATVTDIAIGVNTVLGKGEKIPDELVPRVAAVVVFGNPLKLTLGDIGRDAPKYRDKAMDICNSGDPVCASGFNVLAHITYGLDGATNKGADFAANKVKAMG